MFETNVLIVNRLNSPLMPENYKPISVYLLGGEVELGVSSFDEKKKTASYPQNVSI